ncbi:MAG: cysteine hydrolase [Cyanobacteria bacterium TGS_CYA1]|nr:cysteine hydrolase [Cyanobacteria bacterium TGS_CYA1]
MEKIKSKSTALILIDVQKGFDSNYWGVRNNLDAEKNMQRLLLHWRENKMPIVHVKHVSTEPESPLRPTQDGNDFKPEVEPLQGEHIEEKNVNSAFIGTGLEKYLRQNNIGKVVLVGLTTDHCVSTTTRMAANLGFDTYVISDATATFNRTALDGKNLDADSVHEFALASLNGEFATVVDTNAVLHLLDKNSD